MLEFVSSNFKNGPIAFLVEADFKTINSDVIIEGGTYNIVINENDIETITETPKRHYTHSIIISDDVYNKVLKSLDFHHTPYFIRHN